jgi:hypothetical protein
MLGEWTDANTMYLGDSSTAASILSLKNHGGMSVYVQ